MTLKLMIAGATLALAAAGAAYAGPAKIAATPSQPVPYGKLDAYLKATPKARAAMLADSTSQGVQTDASANVPDASGPASSDPMNEPAASTGTMPSGPVNPPAAAPPPTNSSPDMGATGSAAPDKP